MANVCPRCNGQGHTNRPPWLPGDQLTWVAAHIGSYTCSPCNGTGILGKPARWDSAGGTGKAEPNG